MLIAVCNMITSVRPPQLFVRSGTVPSIEEVLANFKKDMVLLQVVLHLGERYCFHWGAGKLRRIPRVPSLIGSHSQVSVGMATWSTLDN